MKKEICFLLIVLLMLLSSVCLAYTDIENHWARSSIESLSNIEVIRGYEDDTFRPDEYITRAELVTIVNRLLRNSEESTKYIADNNNKSWYYSEIKKAIASGFIKGDGNENVRPDEYITREETVVALNRAFIIKTSDNVRVSRFADSKDISEWALNSLAVFVEEYYLKGYEDNTVRPRNYITRAELITLVDRLFAEIVVKGNYSGNVYGNFLIDGENVVVNDTMIYGDLIIAEGTNGNVVLENVKVEGNVIIRTPFDVPSRYFTIGGDVVKLYEDNLENDAITYLNEKYGISFAIPKKSRVVEKTNDRRINYKTRNLIVINYECDDNTVYKSFNYAETDVAEKYSNMYERIDYKSFGTVEMGHYYDHKGKTHLILIKRDEVIYTIFLYNLENDNMADSIFDSIRFLNSEMVNNHEIKEYKNKKLFLSFDYVDYIGVDDSYNTNVIFEGDKDFMLFIQVTSITDMEKYSIDELKVMFDSLAQSEGEILKSKIRNVYKYEAIDYTISVDEKMCRTLYVVVGTRLYKFIFTGDRDKVITMGNDIFEDVINSIEI